MNKIVLSTAILAAVSTVSAQTTGYVLKDAYSTDKAVADEFLPATFPSTADPETGCKGPATLQKLYDDQKLVFASFPAPLTAQCISYINSATWDNDDGLGPQPVGTILATAGTDYATCADTCGADKCQCESSSAFGYVLKDAYSTDKAVADEFLPATFPSTSHPQTGCKGPATLQKLFHHDKLVFASFPAPLTAQCISYINSATWEDDDSKGPQPVGTILATAGTEYANYAICPSACGDACSCNSAVAASAAFALAAAILAFAF